VHRSGRRRVDMMKSAQDRAIVLRYYLDLRFEEVGEVLGVSALVARARVYRALARLRVEITDVPTRE